MLEVRTRSERDAKRKLLGTASTVHRGPDGGMQELHKV